MHQLCNVVHCVFGIWILLIFLVQNSSGCDQKWIRMIYLLSCGKKKRNNPTNFFELNPQNQNNFTFPAVFGTSLIDALEMYNRAESDISKTRTTQDHKATIPFVSDGTPSLWMIEDLIDEENDLYRRQLGNLLEKCCRVPPVSSCSAKDFMGACK